MRKCALLMLAAVLLLGSVGHARADIILFYGGDFDPNHANASGLYNGNNTQATAQTYQNFIVPAGQTWVIDRMWSNNLTDGDSTQYSTADWSIRSSVSDGNGGTIIASASGAAATETATGRTAFQLTEFTIEVTGLNVTLGPGTYWMQVTPVDNGSGLSYNSNTFGLNAVGSSNANQQFWNTNDPQFGTFNFVNANNNPDGGVFSNFSSGLAGTLAGPAEVPEPTSLVVFGVMALSAVGYGGWRRRNQPLPAQA